MGARLGLNRCVDGPVHLKDIQIGAILRVFERDSRRTRDERGCRQERVRRLSSTPRTLLSPALKSDRRWPVVSGFDAEDALDAVSSRLDFPDDHDRNWRWWPALISDSRVP